MNNYSKLHSALLTVLVYSQI